MIPEHDLALRNIIGNPNHAFRKDTGCSFARIAAARTEQGKFPWNYGIISEDKDDMDTEEFRQRILLETNRALENPENCLFSLLFPSVNSSESLAKLIHVLGSTPPYFIKQADQGKISHDSLTDYYGIQLRLDLGDGKESWPLVLGPYNFFSPGRRSPVTELIFRTSKQKNNLSTPVTQIGIDDTDLELPDQTYESVYKKTLETAQINRGGFSQEMFRARVAVVIPKSDWDNLKAA